MANKVVRAQKAVILDDYTEAYAKVVRERALRGCEVLAAVTQAVSDGDSPPLYDIWYEPATPDNQRLPCPYGIGLVRAEAAPWEDCCAEVVRLSKARAGLGPHLRIARHGAKWLRYVLANGEVVWGRASVFDVLRYKPVSARLYSVVPTSLIPSSIFIT